MGQPTSILNSAWIEKVVQATRPIQNGIQDYWCSLAATGRSCAWSILFTSVDVVNPTVDIELSPLNLPPETDQQQHLKSYEHSLQ